MQENTKWIVSKKPLYKRMEEKYHNEVELPELEKRKWDLALWRNMHAQRVPIEEIYEHSVMHDQYREEWQGSYGPTAQALSYDSRNNLGGFKKKTFNPRNPLDWVLQEDYKLKHQREADHKERVDR